MPYPIYWTPSRISEERLRRPESFWQVALSNVDINRDFKKWEHDSYHRRGVKYDNDTVRNKFAKADTRPADRKLDYRGRSGEQVLKPGKGSPRMPANQVSFAGEVAGGDRTYIPNDRTTLIEKLPAFGLLQQAPNRLNLSLTQPASDLLAADYGCAFTSWANAFPPNPGRRCGGPARTPQSLRLRVTYLCSLLSALLVAMPWVAPFAVVFTIEQCRAWAGWGAILKATIAPTARAASSNLVIVEADPARMKLATTIVALASVGETDPSKLKWFALHAAQAAFRATKAKAPALPS